MDSHDYELDSNMALSLHNFLIIAVLSLYLLKFNSHLNQSKYTYSRMKMGVKLRPSENAKKL